MIDRLVRATEVGVANEVMLRGLEQDARRVMPADVVGAHTVLGGVASLRWDLDGIHHHFRIALQHMDTATTHNNYAVALSNVEELPSAYEAVTTAYARVPDDEFLLEHAIRLSIHAGRFAEGRRLCERWNALVPDAPNRFTHDLDRLARAVAADLFSESKVRRLLGIMSELQRDDRVRTVASATWEDAQEPGSFLHEQFVDATTVKAGRLNATFVDQVASHADLMEDPGLRFVPVFIGARS